MDADGAQASQVSFPKREKKNPYRFSMKVNTSLVFVVDECNFVQDIVVKESAAIEDLLFATGLGAFHN